MTGLQALGVLACAAMLWFISMLVVAFTFDTGPNWLSGFARLVNIAMIVLGVAMIVYLVYKGTGLDIELHVRG